MLVNVRVEAIDYAIIYAFDDIIYEDDYYNDFIYRLKFGYWYIMIDLISGNNYIMFGSILGNVYIMTDSILGDDYIMNGLILGNDYIMTGSIPGIDYIYYRFESGYTLWLDERIKWWIIVRNN